MARRKKGPNEVMDNTSMKISFWKGAPDKAKREADAQRRWKKKSKKEQQEIRDHFKTKNSRLI